MRTLIIALLLVCASVAAQEGPPVVDVTPVAATGDSNAASREKAAQIESAKLATAGGWQHLRNGDAAAAIKLFNTAASLNPNEANAYWGLGVATAKQRKFDISLQLFERAYALDPNNVRLIADIGLAYTRAAMDDACEPTERKEKLQKAIAWYDKAEKLDSSYALTYANRAVALAYLGDYFAASKDVTRAEALDRSSVDPKLVAYLAEKQPCPGMAAAADETKAAPAAVTPAPEPVKGAAPVETLSEKKIVKEEPRPEITSPQKPPAQEEVKPEKEIRVTGNQPPRQKGPDKRHCLDLPTNEAIIRCVYPKR